MASRSRLLVPALRELGIGAVLQYAAYQCALRSGFLRRRTAAFRWRDRPLETWLRNSASLDQAVSHRSPFFFGPGTRPLQDIRSFYSPDLIQEADEILAGSFRLFGGPPVALGVPPDWGIVPLTDPPQALPLDRHWTEYETEGDLDLRLLWEPARFGWAFTLCRAFQFTGEERYAEGVLNLLSSWMEANQPHNGPHWISGQESALRILALASIWHSLVDFLERFPERASQVLIAVAAHAARIPPTLSYARAQRNNHLLTEAVGLYSVGLLMPFFKQSDEWKRLGRKWLIWALEDQVFEDGGYIQYSSNYQRLALNAGLWGALLAEANGEALPEQTLDSLRQMTRFLLSLIEPQTGIAPNWGHNDGSNILPLSISPHADYRPLLQAASRALLGGPAFDPGPWDETSMWLGLPVGEGGDLQSVERTEYLQAGLYLMKGEESRSVLRCARFKARPAHSDQLHLDLWWNGNYIARDAGTYRYTAPPNAFAGALAHNGLVVDRKEPMERAGRFLWLNWSSARFLGRWQAEDGTVSALAAEHPMWDGITHRRSVVHAGRSLWVVLDELIGPGGSKGIKHSARLAWSLIDWPWDFEGQRLSLQSDHGPVQLRLTPLLNQITLYRAGERVAGDNQLSEDAATLGWWSPTYGYKEPALTMVAALEGELPLRLTSWWRLGEVEPQDLVFDANSLAEDPLIAFLSSG